MKTTHMTPNTGFDTPERRAPRAPAALLALLLALIPAHEACAQTPQEIERALEQARSYEFGQSRESLAVIAQAMDHADSEGAREALCDSLGELLTSPDATLDARRFAFQTLSTFAEEPPTELILDSIEAIESTEAQEQLIHLLAEQNTEAAADGLLWLSEYMTGGSVQRALSTGLMQTVRPYHVRALAERVKSSQGFAQRMAAGLVGTAASRNPDTDEAIDDILDALGEPEYEASMLQALGVVGGDRAFEIVSAKMDEPDSRNAAVSALMRWEGDEALPALRDLFGEDLGRRMGSPVRAYLRCVESGIEERSWDQTVALIEPALDAATPSNNPRFPSEFEVAFGLLERAPTRDGLALAMDWAKNGEGEASQRAQRTAMKIATELPAYNRDQAAGAIYALYYDPETPEDVRALAAPALDRIESELDHVLAWRVAGPYRADGVGGGDVLNHAFSPEQDPADPAASPDILWQDFYASNAGSPGRFNLETLDDPSNCVAYALTHVWSPADQPVRLDIGSDDGVKVWVNGDLVHNNNASRALSIGQDHAQADLKQGWNTLLMKISQGNGGWEFACRLRSPDGLPLRGVYADAHQRRRAAPEDAIVLFDGSSTDALQHRNGDSLRWDVNADDRSMTVKPGSGDAVTRESFEDFTLHVEFMCPEGVPPGVTGQARSNSGVYMLDCYEVQVLDSWGLEPMENGCGSIYRVRAPTVNASRRPGEWQTYDIEFTAARWNDKGEKVSPARLTVWHNGVLVQRDVHVDGPTGAGGPEKPGGGQIRLQDHGNPIKFRNIWIVPHTSWDGAGASGYEPLTGSHAITTWSKRGGEADYKVLDSGEVVGSTRPNTPNTFLCSKDTFGDFELEYEFKVDPSLNSGVQIRSASSPEYRNGRVHGYQIEIDPSDRAWTAGVYDEAQRGWLQSLEGKPAAQAAFRQNEWNRVRVVARGDVIRTYLNGTPVAVLADGAKARGFFGLQVHGVGDRADPLDVRWRDLRIKRLD